MPSQTNSYVYPTLIKNSPGELTHLTYLPCSGAKQSLTDANGATAHYSYDFMGRLTDTYLPDGGHSQTVYHDLQNSIDKKTFLTGSAFVQETDSFDGLGRTTQTQLITDPQGKIFADTSYDALGRVMASSNPYRSSTDVTYGVTTFRYDALGRKTSKLNPDGTISTSPYSGASSTSIDESGHSWQKLSDVWETLLWSSSLQPC